MKKFKDHNGNSCLYVIVKDGFILVMDDTFEEHYEFYYIALDDYRPNAPDWRRHLSEKVWGTPELIGEIDRQAGLINERKAA